MKKIGIITIYKTDNYGAELQAFATQCILSKMGYDAEIIDYLYYKNWKFKDTKKSRPFISMNIVDRFKYWLKYRLIKWVIDEIAPYFNKQIRLRNQRFDTFHKENTKMSKCYKSMPDLYNASMDYDVYIVGSDQVWNPYASSSIEPYFLTFAPQVKKKIAYASSFGITSIEKRLQSRYKDLLSNIDEISVREQAGVELVKQLVDKEAKLVLDPTLLLNKEEWKNYEEVYHLNDECYILIYQLSGLTEINRLAKMKAKQENLPIYKITKRAYGMKKEDGIVNITDAGPAQFLYLMAHASLIVTDSFHGTAFSANLGIPFYSVLKRNVSKNSRIESLLNQLHLQERICYRDTIDSTAQNPINMEFIQCQLDKLRQESMNFLRQSIN